MRRGARAAAGGRCSGETPPNGGLDQYRRTMADTLASFVLSALRTIVLGSRTVQGKPAVRRGRKAKGLLCQEIARLPMQESVAPEGRDPREVDPGALHHRHGSSGVDGAHTWRGHPLVGVRIVRRSVMSGRITAHAVRLILALVTIASSALILEAGQRWR